MRSAPSVATLLAGALLLGIAGCPVGAVEQGGDARPPQRDVAGPDGDVGTDGAAGCGDGVCDPMGGEDCESCLQDCRGVSCAAVLPLTVQQYRQEHLGKTGRVALDLRSWQECLDAHLPGVTRCTELGEWWDGAQIVDGGAYLDWATATRSNPLILYSWAAAEATVLAVGEAAVAAGYEDVWWIDGGIDAWRAEAWYQDIAFEGIEHLYYPPGAGVWLIDTNDATHFADCHVEGAVNLYTYDFYWAGELIDGGQALLDLSDPADGETLIFYCINAGCVASEQGSLAAEMLGYPRIFHYRGGNEDWIAHGGPVAGAGCTLP